MLAASVILFILTINAGDPLGDLRESTSPNRQNLIDRRIAVMHLNDPWYTRYFAWLGGASASWAPVTSEPISEAST